MRFILIGSVLFAGAAWAHEGVKDPGVMARMQSMKAMGADTKVIGQMAKGQTAFDAEVVRAKLVAMADESAKMADLFRGAEQDPKSEALPVIWENFSDFEARADAMEMFLRAEAERLSRSEGLGPFMKELGAQCGACHKVYRK